MRGKIDKCDLLKMNSLFNKTHHKDKRQDTNWVKTFATYINIENIKRIPTTQEEKDNPIEIGAKETNRGFAKEKTQLANKHMKDAQFHWWSGSKN